MPTYNYICQACNEEVSVTQSINEERAIPDCPKCDKPMTIKFGLQTIKFNGTGWGKD